MSAKKSISNSLEWRRIARRQAAEITVLRAALALAQAPEADYLRLVRFMEELYPAVVMADRAGLVTWVSAGFTALCGFELSDMVGRPAGRFVRPALNDAPTLAYIERCVREHQPFQYEARNPQPGREADWIRVKVQPLYDAQRQVVAMAGMLEDITAWKHTQGQLAQSERRFQLLAENVPVVLFEWHKPRDGFARFGYVSPQVQEVFGVAAADVQPLHAYTLPEDQAALDHSWLVAVRDRAPWVYEGRVQVPGQPLRWVRGSATFRRADATEVVYSGIFEDVTALRTAGLAEELSTLRLAQVVAHLPLGVVLEDEGRRIVLANDALANLLHQPLTRRALDARDGSGLTDVVGMFMQEPALYAARVAELLRERRPVVGDVLRPLDGRVLLRDFTPVYDHEHYVGQLWQYEDITIRASAEAELRRREEKYRGIIENMSLSLVETDLHDHLLYANQSFYHLTGFSPEELQGQQGVFAPMLTSPSRELLRSKDALRQKGLADSYEIAITTKSGENKWLLVSGAPVYDEAGQVTGSIGIGLDVTPQKALEASLREAKALAESSARAKQDFLANMSHEIRTPMNAIQGMSRLLANTPLRGPQAAYLHAITASAENLLVIIDDILDFSKIEAGRLDLEVVDFSPRRVCAQVKKTLQYKAEEKGLVLVTYVGAGIPAVLRSDPHRLTQILLNLAGNAVKFTERGRVRVGLMLVRPPANGVAEVAFTVQDTGVGIDPAYLARAFDDFSQQDVSVTRRFGGTGLGLGISRRLVALLGGELRLDSEQGRGTTARFTLRLPVGAAQALPQPNGAGAGPWRTALRGRRVLLVEDNFFNRLLARVTLENAGLNVTEAEDGAAAVAAVRAAAPSFDAVLMDVHMPVLNGYDATAVLRTELGLSLPIIALTANATSGERAKCLAAGMNDYLSKPFQEDDLLRMLYEWVLGSGASVNSTK
ncbi:PAS domain S-box protein [Hymenobacter sp. UYCo722]|uniref:PAS domain-containing hybrid sensor histidine kinase/response regulator n=1 Tax=Hymenobacter sp. UYCo722 TaxID=3156335 RepID=UPI00339538E1